MKDRSRSRGAITVEAAIVLPVFICVVFSLAMIIKLIYIHDIIQHSIDEAANELAAYSYFYHISELQDVDNAVQDTIEDNSAQAQGHAEAFLDAYETIEKSLKTGKEAVEDFSRISESQEGFLDKAQSILNKSSNVYASGKNLTKENLQNIKDLQQALGEAAKDPRKEAVSIAWMLSEGMYSDAKTIIAVPVVRETVRKYLVQEGFRDIDMRLKKLNIIGGFDGLDFYSSTFFDGNQDIDIIVKYKVELPLPIKLLPDIYIAQRSTARAWLEGGDGTALEVMDIWSLPNKQRGEKIEEMYGGSLPYDFPVIDSYDAVSKTGTSIKSIDLRKKTYQNSEVLRKKLTAYVDALKECNVIRYKDKDYYLSSKRLILVIPKDSINDSNKAVIEDIVRYANANGIQTTISEL